MTIIVVGHDYETNYPNIYALDSGSSDSRSEPISRPCGIFAVSDSAITEYETNSRLLSGFRKVYEVPVKLWRPYIRPHGYFNGEYYEVVFEMPAMVAFSGSTLLAMHALNLINEHLGNLRASYDKKNRKYIAVRNCQANPMTTEGLALWNEEMFSHEDLKPTFNAKLVFDVFDYSISEAASSYRRTSETTRPLHVEFALGIWCPVENHHRLFVFDIREVLKDGTYFLESTRKEIHEGQTAVLGVSSVSEEVQSEFERALAEHRSPAKAMSDFVVRIVDEYNERGDKSIGGSIVIKRLCDRRMDKEMVRVEHCFSFFKEHV